MHRLRRAEDARLDPPEDRPNLRVDLAEMEDRAEAAEGERDRLRQALASAIECIRASAWDAAQGYVAVRVAGAARESVYAVADRERARALLTALYFLGATPGEEQMNVDELIGARAWVVGEPGDKAQRKAA